MHASPESLYALIGLSMVLGMKHGMDADHLATIDGLTRFNATAGRPRLARLCGFLFSLGHGAVVCVTAVSTGWLFHGVMMPQWLDSVGIWVSTFFLVALGGLNLYVVLSTPPHEMVSLTGLKGRWLGRLNRAGSPVAVALVGALFAVSFDTLSQATLLSAASVHFGGALYALVPALCFTSGMMLTDAVNGIWISHLLRRSDATARSVSRAMGLTVALLSLGLAMLGLSRHYVPVVAAWQEGRELSIGMAVVGLVAGCFLLARYYSRRVAASA